MKPRLRVWDTTNLLGHDNLVLALRITNVHIKQARLQNKMERLFKDAHPKDRAVYITTYSNAGESSPKVGGSPQVKSFNSASCALCFLIRYSKGRNLLFARTRFCIMRKGLTLKLPHPALPFLCFSLFLPLESVGVQGWKWCEIYSGVGGVGSQGCGVVWRHGKGCRTRMHVLLVNLLASNPIPIPQSYLVRIWAYKIANGIEYRKGVRCRLERPITRRGR